VILYHRTDSAQAIVDNGFRDAEGTYLTGEWHTGVWVSDIPLDVNEGAQGDQVLAVDVGDADLSEWEWIEEGKTYREWLVPADVLNRYPVRAEV
jgi:hypothetical protein